MSPNTVLIAILFFGYWTVNTSAARGRRMKSPVKFGPDRDRYMPRTQRQLVSKLRKLGYIKSDEIANVTRQVDHKYYAYEGFPYDDTPRCRSYGARASDLHMAAFALESLKDHLKPGNKVLDVACCSGYLTVSMALMVGKTGLAVGLADAVEQVETCRSNVNKHLPHLLEEGRLRFVDGTEMYDVIPRLQPFDAIHVSLIGYSVQEGLLLMLNRGGRMMMPLLTVGGIWVKFYDKQENGTIIETDHRGVYFID